MRKLLITLSMMFCFATVTFAQKYIYFTTGPVQGKPIRHDSPKSPMQPPTVYIEDYTLYFEANHPEYVLNIKDEDGDVVYTTTVFSTQTDVILPSILSGNYEINLVMGNWLFTGWIYL